VHEYCQKRFKEKGYSIDRGILEAADHFASAFISNTELYTQRLFQKPNLNFYNRIHPQYPLSIKSAESNKPHTIVVACTGAGKPTFYSVVAKEGYFTPYRFKHPLMPCFNGFQVI